MGPSFLSETGSASQCVNLASPKGFKPSIVFMSSIKLTPYVSKRLFQLVRQMRDAQKLYFASRSSLDLKLAKRQEMLVDRLLAIVDDGDGEHFVTLPEGPEVDVI